MFKFPEGSEVHLQCDVQQCNGGCADEVCPGDTLSASLNKGGRALGSKSDADGMLLAATTVFVLDPSEAPRKLFSLNIQIDFSYIYSNHFLAEVSAVCEDSGIRPPWLLWLAITLGILFLIMLLMNIFLCTAMSCSCARTEVSSQKYHSFNAVIIPNWIIQHFPSPSDHRERAIDYWGIRSIPKLARKSIWITLFAAWSRWPQ